MDFLLRLKAWQLFLVLMLLFTIPSFWKSFFIYDLVVFALIYFSWVYSIGIKMNALIPAKIRPSAKSFNIQCLLIPFALVLPLFIAYLAQGRPNVWIYLVLIFASIGFYFYIIFSAFMFAARMLESMIEGYIVNRSDALKAFFCLWMFPMGVWYIQPAMQRVLAKYEPSKSETDLSS